MSCIKRRHPLSSPWFKTSSIIPAEPKWYFQRRKLITFKSHRDGKQRGRRKENQTSEPCTRREEKNRLVIHSIIDSSEASRGQRTEWSLKNAIELFTRKQRRNSPKKTPSLLEFGGNASFHTARAQFQARRMCSVLCGAFGEEAGRSLLELFWKIAFEKFPFMERWSHNAKRVMGGEGFGERRIFPVANR